MKVGDYWYPFGHMSVKTKMKTDCISLVELCQYNQLWPIFRHLLIGYYLSCPKDWHLVCLLGRLGLVKGRALCESGFGFSFKVARRARLGDSYFQK